jgi:nicotinate-nucleotide pyrophosphorylase (carboxylating)
MFYPEFFMMYEKAPLSLHDIIHYALAEDLDARGDITSKALFDGAATGRAVIKSKESGVLSGGYLLEPVFHANDHSITVELLLSDGGSLEPGTRICTIRGPLLGILSGERIALNFLQRLSGIATMTAALARRIAHTKARILDTRKTTPMLRALEKRAVLDGGGLNHRFGLFDMVLIKDTHVKAMGGVGPALVKARSCIAGFDRPVKIEIEVQTWEEFLEALSLAPDRIMFDNMNLQLLAACVERARVASPSMELEASGGITAETIASVAETGVDFISVGAITHSVKALDIHLIIE